MLADLWDYIVVGGGLAGAVFSNRLVALKPGASVLLIEAGPNVNDNQFILPAANYPLLIGSQWDWNYTTVPQVGMNNRVIPNPSGKALGGSTVINACGWFRGDSDDYNEWATVVGDPRWNYNNQLPFFKRVETVLNPGVDVSQHGTSGPITAIGTKASGRNFPLRDTLKDAFNASGIEYNPDHNGGNPLGVAEWQENRKNGLRQISSVAYPLGGVTVLTDSLVKKVLITTSYGKSTATGVQLQDGTVYSARKEVIIAAGGYRTPQLLMLSGIGPKAHLQSKGITTIVDNANVGENLADHVQHFTYWKLKHPEQGLALGSDNPLFNEPQFGLGLPIDWINTITLPREGLKAAIKKDEGKAPSNSHRLLSTVRSFIESIILYSGANAANPAVPGDGSHIAASTISLMVTSKGTVKLATADARDQPLIDPRYLTTEVDKFAYRTAIRGLVQAFLGTSIGQSTFSGETPPDGFAPLSANTTDAEIDARVAKNSITTYHPHGTAAMGKVVDNKLKVKGVDKLRIVDASVIPVVIAAHLQQAVYALAEQAATLI